MVHIRPATEADFPALLHVQQAAFGEYANVYTVSGWTTETLDSLREDAREKHIFVAEAEGTVAGSVRFWTVAGVCIIRLLSVSPAHQGHGVATSLIREIERVATDAHKFFACTMLRTGKEHPPVHESRLQGRNDSPRSLRPSGLDLFRQVPLNRLLKKPASFVLTSKASST